MRLSQSVPDENVGTCRRYDDIVAKLGGDTEAERFMGNLFQTFGSYLATPEALQEVRRPLHC